MILLNVHIFSAYQVKKNELAMYNPQNEALPTFETKRSFSQNETIQRGIPLHKKGIGNPMPFYYIQTVFEYD